MKSLELAQIVGKGSAGVKDAPVQLSGLNDIFGNVVSAVLYLAGIGLFIFLVLGGIKYITSGGDPKAVDGAKKTITYAIGGVALIAISYLILVLLGTITGVDLHQFNIQIQK